MNLDCILNAHAKKGWLFDLELRQKDGSASTDSQRTFFCSGCAGHCLKWSGNALDCEMACNANPVSIRRQAIYFRDYGFMVRIPQHFHHVRIAIGISGF